MAQAANTTDLFGTLHETLAEQTKARAEDQRARERHDFRYAQLVAPYDGESLPNKDAFCSVQCQDLSPQGFSFLSESQPSCAELVVALGKEPYLHVIAKVVRVSPQRGSEDRFLVGCQFERRLD